MVSQIQTLNRENAVSTCGSPSTDSPILKGKNTNNTHRLVIVATIKFTVVSENSCTTNRMPMNWAY
jgi:hypothetical protein